MFVDVKVPSLGESVNSAYVSRWLKRAGDGVRLDEPLVELDSDKATLAVPSPVEGVLAELLVQEGAEVKIGALLGRVETRAAASAPAPAPASAPPPAPAPEARASTPSDKGPQAGPAARQQAQALGVDVRQVSGSGVRGRVLRKDVEAAAEEPAPVAHSTPISAASPARAESGEAREERVPLTPLRRTIARRLVEAQHSAAMLTTFNEVDMSRVLELRQRYQDRFSERYGIKLGFMSFFVKAAIEALKEFPSANSELQEDVLVYKRYYNIGVAVSAPKGLVVPVVRDADRLSFAETEKTIAELSRRAREGALSPDDLRDGTFTISNGGVFGSLMSTPILNPPQVAILGLHAIQDRPVGVNGQVVLRPMMYVAMSYDHRVLDGREAVGTLKRIKELIEAPERILLEV